MAKQSSANVVELFANQKLLMCAVNAKSGSPQTISLPIIKIMKIEKKRKKKKEKKRKKKKKSNSYK